MKLSEQAQSRVYVKINAPYPRTQASLAKGLIGPITSRNTRFILASSDRRGDLFTVGEVDVETSQLVNVQTYGPENTRDAQIVLAAFASL